MSANAESEVQGGRYTRTWKGCWK